MEEKELYLKMNGNGLERTIELQSFDASVLSDEMFLFKEAAIVMLYPDGAIEAVRVGAGVHHSFYYKKLYEASKRFKEAVDSVNGELKFDDDESTYMLDCALSKVGISTFHNVNLYNIPFNLGELKDFDAVFYGFECENTTPDEDKNLKTIYENYPEGSIIKNKYSSVTDRFERENKEQIRRM